ncbi:hypothetical protein [Peribacillus simplex]|uniref:hypothetical protein n=1 Tax=Peribacillus simplex TaxID=1478 RepID=UPI003D288162
MKDKKLNQGKGGKLDEIDWLHSFLMEKSLPIQSSSKGFIRVIVQTRASFYVIFLFNSVDVS